MADLKIIVSSTFLQPVKLPLLLLLAVFVILTAAAGCLAARSWGGRRK
ncbi:MAG: hypothetical protein IK116_01145 [Firmicutes bacterium]|nr:hypothetical protein [Bacillota bacterium]